MKGVFFAREATNSRGLRQRRIAPGAEARFMVRHNRQKPPAIIVAPVNGLPASEPQYMPDSTVKNNCPVQRNIRPFNVPVAGLVSNFQRASTRLPFPGRIRLLFLLGMRLNSEAGFARARL